MTPQELKNGMIVKARNNEYYMVLNDRFVGSNGYMRINEYDSEFACRSPVGKLARKYDIVAVYDIPTHATNMNELINSSVGAALIWKRTERNINEEKTELLRKLALKQEELNKIINQLGNLR